MVITQDVLDDGDRLHAVTFDCFFHHLIKQRDGEVVAERLEYVQHRAVGEH